MGPVGPLGPVSPLGALSPMGPLGPMGPLNPLGPMGPLSPLGPLGPMGPLGPVNPLGPTTPPDNTGPQPNQPPGVVPPNQPPAEPEPDQKKISAAANNLFKAMDGWGTDEKAVHDAMRGMSPKEIAALKKEYQAHFGRDLTSDIKGEMSGEDLAEAEAMLTADPVKSAVAQLNNAANGGFLGLGTDEDKIKSVLSSLPDPDTRKKVADEYEKTTGTKLGQMLQNEMSSYDLAESKALLDGDKNAAAAIKLDRAMNGGVFGWGTDEKGIYDTLAGAKTQAERDEIAKLYKERTGEKLDAAFKREMSGAEKDVATSLMAGDETAAAAAKIKVAAQGWGTDEDAIYKELENIGASEKDPAKAKAKRDAMIAAYDAKYGDKKSGGESFSSMIDSEFGGMDREKASMLAQDGKLSNSFALKYAMHSGPFGGLGTDEALLRTTLDGKSKAEIAQIKEDYRKAYGHELDADLNEEVDGRDGFELGQMMKGKPTTPQEMMERANENWEFERGSGASGFSNTVMDLFSNRGEVLDKQHERLKVEYEKAKSSGQIDEKAAARIAQLYGWQGQDVKSYQESKDSVTNTAAAVATITAAAALTALSGGAGSPALVAALAEMGMSTAVASGVAAGGISLVSGGAGMLTKYGMLGDSYGGQDMAIDGGKALMTALTAGLGKGLEPGISNYLGIAGKEAQKIPLSFTEALKKNLLTDGFANLSGAVVNTAFDEKAYKGDDFLGILAQNLGKATVSTGFSSVAKGLATPVSDMVGIDRLTPGGAFKPATVLQSMMRDGITGGIGGLGTGLTDAAFDPTSWNTAGGFFGNALERGGLGMLGQGLGKAASGGIDAWMGSSTMHPYLWSLLKGGVKGTAETGIGNAFNPKAWSGDQATQWMTTMVPGVLKGATGDANKTYGKNVQAAIDRRNTEAQAAANPPPVTDGQDAATPVVPTPVVTAPAAPTPVVAPPTTTAPVVTPPTTPAQVVTPQVTPPQAPARLFPDSPLASDDDVAERLLH